MRRIAHRLRIVRRVAAVAALLAFCFIGYGVAPLIGGSRLSWVRRFLGGTASALGADVAVVGTPYERDTLFVANHLSWFDILAVGGATGSAFVSKDHVADWPIIGRLARLAGTVFVMRGSRADTGRQMDALATALADGRAVTLFPEGTTNDGLTILPFRSALLAAAIATGVRIQPVAIDYGPAARDIAWGPDEPALAVASRLVGRRGRLPIRLHFLPPLPPTTDRKRLAIDARAAIVAHFAGRAGG